jgi:hypothetical protein
VNRERGDRYCEAFSLGLPKALCDRTAMIVQYSSHERIECYFRECSLPKAWHCTFTLQDLDFFAQTAMIADSKALLRTWGHTNRQRKGDQVVFGYALALNRDSLPGFRSHRIKRIEPKKPQC